MRAGPAPITWRSPPSSSPPCARARQVRDLADLIGTAALTETDRSYLALADAFTTEFVDQRVDEARSPRRHLARGHGRWSRELPAAS